MQLSEQQEQQVWDLASRFFSEDCDHDAVVGYAKAVLELRAQADARPVGAMLKLAHDAFSDYLDTGGGSPVAQAKFMNRMREFNLLYNTHPEASAPGLSESRQVTNAPEVSREHILALAKLCKLVGNYTTKDYVDAIVGFVRVVLNDNAVQEGFLRANVGILTRASAATVAEPTAACHRRTTHQCMCPEHDCEVINPPAAQQQAEPESVIMRQAQKIGELIADRDSWIEAHARLYRLYHDQSPRAGEEIHVNVEGDDVFTLPLQRSGMEKPRFVVHVPRQQQAEPGADERAASEAYDKVDRFLRNNLDDADYAEYSEALEYVRAAQSVQRAGVAEEEKVLPFAVLDALRFYANGSHFCLSDKTAWDTVSGEPQNFWCDEAGTATVEDGSIAKAVLQGVAFTDGDDAAAVEGEVYTAQEIAAAPTQQQEGGNHV